MTDKIFYVWATDKFLSGWGVAEGKIHKQVVICESEEERDRVISGFMRNKSFKHVNWDTKWHYFPSKKYTHTTRYASEWKFA